MDFLRNHQSCKKHVLPKVHFNPSPRSLGVKPIEQGILIRCLRRKTDFSAPADPGPARPPGPEWPSLQRTALAHGVFPSLYQWLIDSCPDGTPPDVLVGWQQLYKIHARRNLKVATELISILTLFASQGIVAVAYKGPVLAAVAYGDIALRQFDDLDLLVSRKDMGRIKDLLIAKGFKQRYFFTKKQERMHLKHAHEFTFEHPQRTMLDVHFRFAADYLGGGPDPEEAMARRVPVQILGKTVYSLHPEDNLLMLCQHGTFHTWSELGSVNDVAQALRSQASWNWSGLLQQARKNGLRRQFLLGVSLAQELLGAPVSREILQQADDDASLAALRRQIIRNMLVNSAADRGLMETSLFYFKTRDCFKDKLTFIFIRLFIPSVEDWQWAPLPDFCYGLYYVIRPLRLGLQGLVLPMLRRFQVLFRIKAVHNT